MQQLVASTLLCLFALPAFAQDCRKILGQQAADVASVKRVEHDWDEAFTHGNPDYLACLLLPDYASVSAKGAHGKAWELEHAPANKGNSAPIPDFPGMTYQVQGSTAIVRLLNPASADGKQPASYSADIFVFQDGAWRALYSQHTNLEAAK